MRYNKSGPVDEHFHSVVDKHHGNNDDIQSKPNPSLYGYLKCEKEKMVGQIRGS